MELDETDMKIIELLKKNGRMPLEEMSKELNASKSTIHYRIKKLEEEGIIEGYTVNLNYKKLGYSVNAVICARVNFSEMKYHEIIEEIKKLDQIISIESLLGENDLLIHIISKNEEHLKEELKKLINIKGIERTSTYIIIEKV
ncbi:MAG: Lrp/AsnC family transcriptional regulator [Thermoplasmata archaeon]|jgi:DNA-binding Lrp family transcriptional regulator